MAPSRKLSESEWRERFLEEINRHGSSSNCIIRARKSSRSEHQGVHHHAPATRKVSFDYYVHPTQRESLAPPNDENLEPAALGGLEVVQFSPEAGVEEKLIVWRPDSSSPLGALLERDPTQGEGPNDAWRKHLFNVNNNASQGKSTAPGDLDDPEHWPPLLGSSDNPDVSPIQASKGTMLHQGSFVKTSVFGLLRFWRSMLVVLVPLVALPLVFSQEDDTKQAFRCAYVMVIMAVFWVTEALPLAITSLIPVALLPILGIMTTDEVGKEYLKETNMMFISGIIVAIAVEHCNLHKRIALNVLCWLGTSPRRVMLGFMLPTCFLSMWMSNTATTAMMVPIVDAVTKELEKDEDEDEDVVHRSDIEGARDESAKEKERERIRDLKKLKTRHMIFLSIAYAANTGGTGSLTGTGSNLILKGVVAEFPGQSPINFANWMFYAVPAMLLNLLACWIWLQYWFIGLEMNPFRWCSPSTQGGSNPSQAPQPGPTTSSRSGSSRRNQNVHRILKQKIEQLGSVSFHEGAVFSLFVILVLLWLFRDPKFITGWGNFVHIEKERFVPQIDGSCSAHSNCTYIKETYTKEAIDDATSGMLIVLLLFILPARLNFWPFNRCTDKKANSAVCSQPSVGLLEWSAIHDRMPWALVLLLGGGFALAKATDVSGLSRWMGSQLEVLNFLDHRVLVLVICLLTAIATEVTSNVATASILLPVLRDLAISLEINPLYLMVPATLTCSYAFMLPVATPPNAIVYSASGMKTSDMFKCGFFVNIICVLINYACLNSYGIPLFQLDVVPEWVIKARRA